MSRRKEITGYPGMYLVSDCGKIRSLDRVVDVARGKYIVPSREMKSRLRNGYLAVGLRRGGKTKHYSVHRLVAQAFLINPQNKKTVNHKNGIKTDNRVKNLERNTYSENNNHAINVLGKESYLTGAFGGKHNTAKAVVQMDLHGKIMNTFDSLVEAQRYLGKATSGISSCCKGVRKTCLGYKREYAIG